ncbi:M50 family metallopeptidase [Colwelliaceae bacterium 6471]
MLKLQTNTSAHKPFRHSFWLFLLVAIIAMQLPFVSIPFKWLESFFHEISHGFAAILTGGKILQIELFPNGAGLCTTRGGSRFIVSFMGYSGAIVWGSIIYMMALSHQRVSQIFSVLLIILLSCTLLLWVRDVLTFLIVIILLALFIVKLKMSNLQSLQMILRFTGLMVLLNSLMSPFYLIDGRNIGDGNTLAALTGIPEIFWVIIWFSLGISASYFLAKKTP